MRSILGAECLEDASHHICAQCVLEQVSPSDARLVVIIHPLHAVTNARKYLIRNGLKYVRQHCDGQMLTEYLNSVSFFTVNTRRINQCYIHTNIAHIGSTLPIDQTIAMPVS